LRGVAPCFLDTAHLPGAIVFKRELVFLLLQNVCGEMGPLIL